MQHPHYEPHMGKAHHEKVLGPTPALGVAYPGVARPLHLSIIKIGLLTCAREISRRQRPTSRPQRRVHTARASYEIPAQRWPTNSTWPKDSG